MSKDHESENGTAKEKRATFSLGFLRLSAGSGQGEQGGNDAAVDTMTLDPPVVGSPSEGAPPTAANEGLAHDEQLTPEVVNDEPVGTAVAPDDESNEAVVVPIGEYVTEQPQPHDDGTSTLPDETRSHELPDLGEWVQQAEDAVARAKSSGSAVAWKEAALLASAVYEVTRVTEAVVIARKDTEEKVKEADSAAAIAKASAQMALTKMEAAREALQVAEELERAVELARSANTLAAWREAAQLVSGTAEIA